MSKKQPPRPAVDHPPPSPKNPPPKRKRVHMPVAAGEYNDPYHMLRAAAQNGEGTTSTAPSRDRSNGPLAVGRTPGPAPAVADRAPPLATNPSRAPMSSKTMTDKFMALERAIQTLSDDRAHDIEVLEKDIKELQTEVSELRLWKRQAEEATHNLSDDVVELKEMLQALQVGGGARLGRVNGKSKGRNTGLARTVRTSLKSLMMRVSAQGLPDPLVIDGKVTYWYVEGAYRVLHPNWEQDWEQNERGWVQEAAEKIRTYGAEWDGTADAEELQAYSIPVIAQAIQATFQTWTERWKTSKKSIEDQLAARRVVRHKGRRNVKTTIRLQFRHTVPELMGPEYDWFFTVTYASSDDSEGDADEEEAIIRPAIDSDSDEAEDAPAKIPEANVKASLSRKKPAVVTISRPPVYRDEKMEPLVVKLSKNITKKREWRRIRGPPKDVPLPKPRNKKDLKLIPRTMINAKWLAAHPDEDRPTRIASDDECDAARKAKEHEKGEEGNDEGGEEAEAAPEPEVEEEEEDEDGHLEYLDPLLR